MILEISEYDQEEAPEIIDPEVQKQRIRHIIEYQKSLFMAYTFSSSVASCSLLPSSQKGNSLLELIERRRFSLGKLFEMENTSLAAHFQDFRGWPMIKPIDLWDNDREDKFHDPWMFVRQIGPTKDLRPDELEQENRERETSMRNRKLSRTKSFGRLPRSGCCWFKLKSGRLQIMVCGRKL